MNNEKFPPEHDPQLVPSDGAPTVWVKVPGGLSCPRPETLAVTTSMIQLTRGFFGDIWLQWTIPPASPHLHTCWPLQEGLFPPPPPTSQSLQSGPSLSPRAPESSAPGSELRGQRRACRADVGSVALAGRVTCSHQLLGPWAAALSQKSHT